MNEWKTNCASDEPQSEIQMTQSNRNPNPEILSLKPGSAPTRLGGWGAYAPPRVGFDPPSGLPPALPSLPSFPWTPGHSSFRHAFTLIELLVVIAIIAVLAAMIFPIVGAVNKVKLRSVAEGGLTQVETAIQSYKAKYGFYPPDNPSNAAVNQLYFELLGTTASTLGNAIFSYTTLDGSATINLPGLNNVFGPNVAGFMNSTKGAGGDEGPVAVNFLKGLKAVQFLAVTNPTSTFLGAPLDGPLIYQSPTGAKINPWRYNSSSPTNNPNSYDLWIDVLIAGKTNRFSNWSKQPLIVY